jgi:hypothetical protein
MSRRFQFSLKWLFVAMMAVAAFFGGWFYGNKDAAKARRALETERDNHAKTMDAFQAALLGLERANSEPRRLERQ